MRYLLTFWGVPMAIYWTWYTLAANDWSFGLAMFSRKTHDFAFGFYGALLGVDPATLPPMVTQACITDTILIFAIYGFRRRRDIAAWWRARRAEPAAVAAEELQPSA